jgi:hypothetical protein
MGLNMPMFPFEVSLEEICQDPERYVDAVFSCLESEFLVMTKGEGFVEYPGHDSENRRIGYAGLCALAGPEGPNGLEKGTQYQRGYRGTAQSNA